MGGTREGTGEEKKNGMAQGHPGSLKATLSSSRFFGSGRRTGGVGGGLLSLANHAADTRCCLFHYIVIEVGVAGRHGLTAMPKGVTDYDK